MTLPKVIRGMKAQGGQAPPTETPPGVRTCSRKLDRSGRPAKPGDAGVCA